MLAQTLNNAFVGLFGFDKAKGFDKGSQLTST